MKRTQIYITEEQDRRIGELAADRGTPKAVVIRDILNAALGSGDAEGEARAAIRATAGLLEDAPEWATWLGEVRGRTAAARLGELHGDHHAA